MRRTLLPLLVALAAFLTPSAAGAASLPGGFSLRPMISGLDAPTAVSWAPDGRMFISEQKGIVLVVPPGSSSPTQLLDISAHVNSFYERGLLGIVPDSAFASNGYLYLSYTLDDNPLDDDNAKAARVTRVTVQGDNTVANPASPETTIIGDYPQIPCPSTKNVDCVPTNGITHTIGAIRAGNDGSLWVAVGDGASADTGDPLAFRAFDVTSYGGKLLHVSRTGKGLKKHPFCPKDHKLTDVCTKVFARGLRNPFRFSFLPHGALAAGDVGAGYAEELDLVKGGQNMGWPCYEGTAQSDFAKYSQCKQLYKKERKRKKHGKPPLVTKPAYQYFHNFQGSVVVAGPRYAKTRYPKKYRKRVFFADYLRGFIKTIDLGAKGKKGKPSAFATGVPGIVDIEQGPDGNLVLVNYGNGQPGTGSVQELVHG
jgi:glucose/arabinose dehydrogenase